MLRYLQLGAVIAICAAISYLGIFGGGVVFLGYVFAGVMGITAIFLLASLFIIILDDLFIHR